MKHRHTLLPSPMSGCVKYSSCFCSSKKVELSISADLTLSIKRPPKKTEELEITHSLSYFFAVMLQLLEANTSQHLWLRLHQSSGIRNFSTVGFIQLRRSLWTWPANKQKKNGSSYFNIVQRFWNTYSSTPVWVNFYLLKWGTFLASFKCNCFVLMWS